MRSIIFIFIISILLISCGKHDPVNPDTEGPMRESTTFPYSWEIFGDSVDADVAAVVNGPGTGSGNYDTPWQDDWGSRWAVSSAIEIYLNDDHRPVYRFLPDSDSNPVTETRDLLDDLEDEIADEIDQVRLARLDSCYFDQGAGSPFVEVAIAFQYLDPDPEDGDWDIDVALLRFGPDEFQDETSIEPDSAFLLGGIDTPWDDIMPDIAYDPVSGDLYVVYTLMDVPLSGIAYVWVTKLERNSETNDLEIEYTRIAQYIPDPVPELFEWHNGFHPRIDVGLCPFDAYPGSSWKVAIAYSGGKHPFALEGRWHVRINYWPVWQNPGTWNFSTTNVALRDPMFAGFPGGVPQIDIGPPGADQAAIVWTQAKSNDWGNSTVTYMDTHLGYTHMEGFEVDPEPAWGEDCTAFPAVVVHQFDGDPEDPRYTSVSYLRSPDSVTGYWTPSARHVITTPGEGVTGMGSEVQIQQNYYGEWDSGSLVEHYLGLSSAITVFGDSYWMIWSGYDTGGGPDTVYGAWGDTGT